jgi:radical SAM superfamily enzyme YgiQ (UPF0313 family)
MSTIHFIFASGQTMYPVSLSGVAAPVALTTLSSVARKMDYGKFENAICWDCSIHDDKDIIETIQMNDLVCFTVTFVNYNTSIELARQVSQKGAIVAMGGPWITIRAKQIARENEFLDYLVIGEGEFPLQGLLRDAIRQSGAPRIIHGKVCLGEQYVTPDYSCWNNTDLEIYRSQYHQMIASGKFGPPPEQIPTLIFYQSSRGCIQVPRCAFCSSRLGGRLIFRSANEFHLDIDAIQSNFEGIDSRLHIFDTSDSFVSSLGRFNNEYRAHDGVTFTVYSRVDELTRDTVVALRKLGVTKVSLGIESVSDMVLRDLGKNTTMSQNLNAVRLLKSEGISTYLNFLYGVPGETYDSARRTVDHIVDLCRAGTVYRAKGRVVTPLPGSRWFSDLCRDKQYFQSDRDIFNQLELVMTWLAAKTRISLPEIFKINQSFIHEADTLSVTHSESENVWIG